MAIDSAGEQKNGAKVVQWGVNNSLNQRWLLTQNADSSWNIINLASWKALDFTGASKADGIEMVLWTANRDENQRWEIEEQGDGSHKISNLASGKVLDGGSGAENGTILVQNGWSRNEGQRWILELS
ncbi:MAG: hypothetical protein Q9180_006544 [Flavoplaca navasiana]